MTQWIGSLALLATLAGAGLGLASWKEKTRREADQLAAATPEPTESVTLAVAKQREYRRTTTVIGTVLALESVTLRNELPGTVRLVDLAPGRVVEKGAVLVALDVAVEEAELRAQEAQAKLAQTLLGRMERASRTRAVSEMEVDRARAERDVALAQIDRTKAIIERKTIRAPFRARIGLSDVHPGQYLEQGTELTTLQGVGDAAHVDFRVAQQVGAGLREGDAVEVFVGAGVPVPAAVVAVDARVDVATRNALVRARIEGGRAPDPGSAVRIRVPAGAAGTVVAIPVSGLRKGPGGDYVFVVAADAKGMLRAHVRPVESGAMLGEEVLVLEGLAPGEQVAASGSFKLREGVLVADAGAAGQQGGER
jgi:membrane fusion protein (multidrug efflux system)